MRVVATGDNHFDERSRFEECVRVHDWIATYVESRRPRLFVSAGDLTERTSTAYERLATTEWVRRVAHVCPVLLVRGNHDPEHELALFRKLRAPNQIYVIETAGVVAVPGYDDGSMLGIAGMAWPARGSTLDDGVAREATRDVLRGLGAELLPYGRRLLVAHAMVDGAVTSTGQPMTGGALNVGLSDLALAGAHATILGHVHRPQEWSFDGAPIVYTGSPYRTEFGELEEKSIVDMSLDPDGTVRWERIPTPARPMLLVEAVWDAASAWLTTNWPQAVCGAEIRFRFRAPADQMAAAKSEAAETRRGWLESGAVSVKLEPETIPTVVARAPEVAAARTLPEKLQAMWRVRGVEPDQARAERLCGSRLEQLEREAGDAA